MQNKKHLIIISVLVLFLSVIVYYGLLASNLFPVQAAAQAIPIDWLFDLELKLIAFFFSVIVVPIVYSLVVFRSDEGDPTDGPHIEGNTTLEITWTLIPLIIVIILGIIGADNLKRVLAVDPRANVIKVVGFQWGWRFEYPQGFISNELYLPIDQQALLEMESLDVIHSFWVPEFRIKQDIVPGQTTEYRITPNLLGSYVVRCAELCGTDHAYMLGNIHVVSQEEYSIWVEGQVKIATELEQFSEGKPDPDRGKQLYETTGCKACHSIDGSIGVGPSWSGLFGHEVSLADGSVIVADEEYLFNSIKQPALQTVAGYSSNAMPDFSYLKDTQIDDLVEFIKSLE